MLIVLLIGYFFFYPSIPLLFLLLLLLLPLLLLFLYLSIYFSFFLSFFLSFLSIPLSLSLSLFSLFLNDPLCHYFQHLVDMTLAHRRELVVSIDGRYITESRSMFSHLDLKGLCERIESPQSLQSTLSPHPPLCLPSLSLPLSAIYIYIYMLVCVYLKTYIHFIVSSEKRKLLD